MLRRQGGAESVLAVKRKGRETLGEERGDILISLEVV